VWCTHLLMLVVERLNIDVHCHAARWPALTLLENTHLYWFITLIFIGYWTSIGSPVQMMGVHLYRTRYRVESRPGTNVPPPTWRGGGMFVYVLTYVLNVTNPNTVYCNVVWHIKYYILDNILCTFIYIFLYNIVSNIICTYTYACRISSQILKLKNFGNNITH
jgi:hypothetical protein